MILTGICLFWSGLHLMLGTQAQSTTHLSTSAITAGSATLMIAVACVIYEFGAEQGFFYSLFALSALGAMYVQLRVWKPLWVKALSTGAVSLAVLNTGGALL